MRQSESNRGHRSGGRMLNRLAALAGTCIASGGSVLAGAGVVGAALLGVGGLAATAQAQCGVQSLTQSTNPTTVNPSNAVWCGNLTLSAETQIAREFTAGADLALKCVTFGVSQNTGAAWPVNVKIKQGLISAPFGSHTVLRSTSVSIPAGTVSQLFTANLAPVFIPAGTKFIVELETPTRDPAAGGDGKLLSLGFNGLGQSASTYFRGAVCGVPQYVTTQSIGFPNSHAAISLGIDQGIKGAVFGGFPINAIGPATLSYANGEVTALGDGGPTPVGLSVDFGELTMGAGATFKAIATGNEVGASFAIAFKGRKEDRLIFHDKPGDPSRAILTLDAQNPGMRTFDVQVFHQGVHVGTLENQTSGSVEFSQGGGGGTWPSAMFGIPKQVLTGCEGITYIGSTPMFTAYGVAWVFNDPSLYAIAVNPLGGGSPILGDKIVIVSETPMLPGVSQPPIGLDFETTGLQGVLLNVNNLAPTVVIGDALTNPNVSTQSAQIGATFKAIKEHGIQNMVGKDLTGDGLADLSIIPNTLNSPDPTAGVAMDLGGVVSASIGMQVLSPASTGACMMVCATSEGGTLAGWTQFDPWPTFPALIAAKPDFTGIGNGKYTLQVVNNAGTIVFQQSGLTGIAGGSSLWPNKGGKLGGQTPCFTFCYPDGATFKTAAGPTFPVHEIRLLAEEAGPAPLLSSLQFAASNMGELQLFNPVTELPPLAPSCYPDCDGSGSLTIDDFICFQTLYAIGDPAADCDGSGNLNIDDFICFQTFFAIGC